MRAHNYSFLFEFYWDSLSDLLVFFFDSHPENKTNDKDNWVWRIKSYRYDIGESSTDIECHLSSEQNAFLVSLHPLWRMVHNFETRSSFWWLNKDNNISALEKAFCIYAMLFFLLLALITQRIGASGNPVSHFNVCEEKNSNFCKFHVFRASCTSERDEGDEVTEMIKDCANEMLYLHLAFDSHFALVFACISVFELWKLLWIN